jgi:cell division protein FtsB
MRFDGNEIMARDNTGNGTLYLNLDGGTVKVGSVTVTSDRRLKRNIHKLDYGLADLLRLKPVSYEWRPDMFNLPGTQLGFIAQDVQEILPEVVRADNGEESRVENELSLNVNGILPVVVASVQELARENQSLKKELETLRSEMAIFKADLAAANRQSDRLDRLEELVSTIGKGNRDLSSLRN